MLPYDPDDDETKVPERGYSPDAPVKVTRVPVEQGGSFTQTTAQAKLARAQAELDKLAYDLRHAVLVTNSGTDTGAGPVSDALHGLDVIQQALDELGGVL